MYIYIYIYSVYIYIKYNIYIYIKQKTRTYMLYIYICILCKIGVTEVRAPAKSHMGFPWFPADGLEAHYLQPQHFGALGRQGRSQKMAGELVNYGSLRDTMRKYGDNMD